MMDQWLTDNVWGHKHVIDTELDFLPKVWIDYLQLSEFFKKKLQSIFNICHEQRKVAIIYPEHHNIMRWAQLCSPTNIKVIILGQDPYHGGQATGLAFAVNSNSTIPPSLKNIFSELKRTYTEFIVPDNGCLDKWAAQGVLLLNSILTVEKGKPGSHHKLGWTWFTDYIISTISENAQHCVFMLWGNRAIEKEVLINNSRHLVLKAQHPSPLSVVGGSCKQVPFLGCDHFRLANAYLTQHNKSPISWQI